MDLFELSATLGLDTNPFTSALGGVKNMAMKALGEIADLAVDFGKDVLKTGMGFDKEMSAVRAVLGETEGTLENMNRLREFALEQSRDSVFTAEEAAEAYYYMGMAGWKTEQMIAGLPAILALAAASGEDLGKTSDIVTDALTAFGLGAGQATDFADVLAQTATNANTDVARMGQTFKYVAAAAGSLSYSYKDVALSIGLAANAGIKGSQAGTSLRNIFTRLATDAGATANKLGALGTLQDELGVQFYDAAGKARPWLDILVDSREAWRKLDTSKANSVAEAFGMVASEGQDAAQVMDDFTNDLDTWTSEWNLLTTKAERENFAKLYEDQFKALGISMRDSRGELREFNDVASEARIKLGGLDDRQKLAFSNTIGNLRGMTTWLALMNANESDFRKLVDDILDAEGAAQRMADIRRDDLAGDISRFMSEYDNIKNRLYDSTKGPLRELVQAATSSLKEVTDTYMSDGWGAAVDKAFSSLTVLWDKYAKPIVDKIAPDIGDALIKGIEWFNDKGLGVISDFAITIGSGIFNGVKDEFLKSIGSNNGILDTLTFGLYGQIRDLFSGGSGQEYMDVGPGEAVTLSPDKTSGETRGGGGSRYAHALLDDNEPIDISPVLTLSLDNMMPADDIVQAIQNAIDTAIANGDSTIDINGFEFDVSQSAEDVASVYIEYLKGAGTTGGAEMAKNADKSASDVFSSPGLILQSLISMYGLAGKDGGNNMGVNISNAVSGVIPDIADMLTNGIGNAGYSAGNTFANSMQEVLNKRQMVVNTVQNVVSNIVGKVKKNASAMESGRIFKRPTIFGYDDGAFQMAGDAGAEAVIGVNSLADLIFKAVQRGNDGREIVVPRSASAPQNIVIPLYIDGREFARAEVPYIEAEQRRYGVRIANGGAY